MAQHDMVIDNAPGLPVRTDINAAILALVTQSSGPIEPPVMYPGQFWLDTSIAPQGRVRQRNLANSGWTDVQVNTFSTSMTLNGNDVDGRLKFTGTGAVGLEFAAADMSWLAKSGPNRLAVNDAADGTGTDVASIDDTGLLTILGAILFSGATALFRANNQFIFRRNATSGNVHLRAEDQTGVLRGQLMFDLPNLRSYWQVQDGVGGNVQSALLDVDGITVNYGASAGLVLTTGNAVTTGTNSGDPTLPVGNTVAVQAQSTVFQRSQAFTPKLSSNGTLYTIDGAGQNLTGSWRARGMISNAAPNNVVLGQRVA